MIFRLTPLSLVCAALLTVWGYNLIHAAKFGLGWILLALSCFLADLVFRRTLVQLKRIWIIEFLFLIFVAVIILIIKK
ncbi:MAG TPA: hypothetical protein VEV16_11940 [Daejeonella sp.]|nr:hypothetical protein [Daejeonella sp.]